MWSSCDLGSKNICASICTSLSHTLYLAYIQPFDFMFLIKTPFYLFFIVFFIFIVEINLDVPISPPTSLPASTHPSTPFTLRGRPIAVCIYELCIYVLWLVPSPSTIPSLLPITPLADSFSLFHVSMPRSLFCSSIYFVH